MSVETAELVVVDEINTIEKFTDKSVVDTIIERHQEELKAFVPDVSTAKGRKEIASFAMNFRKSKTHFDKVGITLKAEAKAQVDSIDGERKRFRDTCDTMAAEAREPLTAWEDIEKARVAKIQRAIDSMRLLSSQESTDGLTSSQLKDKIVECETIHMSEVFEEFDEDANEAVAYSIEKLNEMFNTRVVSEKEAAELKELRRKEALRAKEEAEEKIKAQAREQAEKESREREERLVAEKKKAEQALVDAKKREEELIKQGEEDRKKAREAIVKAEQDERQRIEKVEAEAKAKQSEREADEKHRNLVIREAAEDLDPLNQNTDEAYRIIKLISEGKIRHITINF